MKPLVTFAVILALGSPIAGAQRAGDTPPVFAGGFSFGACAYPKPARDAGLSGCCKMTLDIDAEGHVVKSSGECTDPVFLLPTRHCLSVQQFVPATHAGQPVAAKHKMDYEWRSSEPAPKNLCARLGVS